MRNKILMIVNIFPPSGESGIQRPVKFLKYFAIDGWETYVITPRKPVNKIFTDDSLADEIPVDTKVFKTFSLGISEDKIPDIRSGFTDTKKTLKKRIWKVIKYLNDLILPIDKQIGWVPFALLKAIQVLNRYKIRNIYITAYPFSAFICGIILKILYGDKIFWVADYRDAWQFAPMLKRNVLPFRYRTICRTDECVLKSADCAVFTTHYVRDWYKDKYPWAEKKLTVITNGYDEDDFTGLIPMHFPKFTFAYMGKIHVTKGDPIPLLKVIKKCLTSEYQYLHFGTIGKQLLARIADEGLDFYQYLGYKSHREALSYSAGADINVIIINNDKDSAGVYPGKLFELLRIGRPILAVGPRESIIRDVFAKSGAVVYACADDEEELTLALQTLLSGTFKLERDMKSITQYSRQKCTKQLEDLYSR